MTGPNASTSCTAGVRASSNESRVTGKNAPSWGTEDSSSGPPSSTVAPASIRVRTERSTSDAWSSDASGPTVVAGFRGSPTTARCAARSFNAATTAGLMAWGTITRRTAVHFCPALAVISRTTDFTNASNSGEPSVTSGAMMAALRESVSAVKRTPFSWTFECARRDCAVAADPVNATWSRASRWSSRSRAEPETSCREPSGSSPESSMSRTHASVTYPVGVAGFTMVGTPAMNAGANFSSMPHTGKLNALICTATPGSRVYTCSPRNEPSRESCSTAPSTITFALGSSRRPLEEKVNRVPMPPSMSIRWSLAVAPVA